MQRLPPRWLCFVAPATAVIYSDAAYTVDRLSIGWIDFLPDGVRIAGAAVIPPRWMECFQERKTQIHIGKALAALSALFSCQEKLRGLRVLHFVDNQAALANLISGSSGCLDIAAVVVWYQILAARLGACPWFEYVESHLNISDLPSRMLAAFVNHTLARKLGIRQVEDACLPAMEDTPPPLFTLLCLLLFPSRPIVGYLRTWSLSPP